MPPLDYAIICPATRGIGLAMTRHLLTTTNLRIIATARNSNALETYKSTILSDLPSSYSPRLSIHPLDITQESTIISFANTIRETESNNTLKLLCSFPGILYPERSPEKMDVDKIRETFDVNVIGHLLMMKHFAEFILPRKKNSSSSSSPPSSSSRNNNNNEGGGENEGDNNEKLPKFPIWACMTARVGSTSSNSLGGWYSYRASKAALASAVKTFNIHLHNQFKLSALSSSSSIQQPICVGLHPGTVKTDLSKEFWESVEKDDDKKLFEKEEAAENLWGVLCGLKKEQGGRVWDWKGEEVLP